MGGEMFFEHKDGRPIGSRMPLYQSILGDIKKAAAHLEQFDLSSSDLEVVDLEYYELCLDLGMPYYILFLRTPTPQAIILMTIGGVLIQIGTQISQHVARMIVACVAIAITSFTFQIYE
ncbi:MAG: hypothetical protein JOS17DRAFT_823233 [Linnemannia elongata]|nr:MAG: hypothetical protein JOS17DRAFT_823233 [Linnemannia elongata]